MHIQNPTIVRIWTYLETKIYKNSVNAYSGIFRTLCNVRIVRTLPHSELWHIQNFSIFRTWGIFRILFHRAYSGIFNNDRCNKINFLFFTLILHTFQRNLARLVLARLVFCLTESTYIRRSLWLIPNLGGHFREFFHAEITPYLKHVRIMLETWHSVR